MLLNSNNERVVAVKCHRPTFKAHRGRTWDCGEILIDGTKIKCHLDTTWGEYVYFNYEQCWYKMKIMQDSGIYINPFNNQEFEKIK